MLFVIYSGSSWRSSWHWITTETQTTYICNDNGDTLFYELAPKLSSTVKISSIKSPFSEYHSTWIFISKAPFAAFAATSAIINILDQINSSDLQEFKSKTAHT